MNITVFSVQISQRFFATIALCGMVFSPLANLPLVYAANVFTSSFENGAANNASLVSSNGWTQADNDWTITSGSGHTGSRKAQVSNQGASDDILRKAISTVGQDTVVLSYYYKTGQPLEANDHVYVEWTANGSSWTQLADYHSLSNGSWTSAVHNLPAGANNNANFAFRFRAVGLEPSTGQGDKDEFQLDTLNFSTEEMLVDVCPNLEGAQANVPEGYVLTDGQCVVVPPPPVDACTNLEGNQATVPEGYVAEGGICTLIPVDVCPNLEGAQANLPEGYMLTDGQCVVIPPPDICPNLEGAQGSVPEGMQIVDGQCIPIPPPDVCPNLEGAQESVPNGYVLTDGQCVEVPPPPVDACPNLEGDQASVPEGMQIVDGQCIPIPPPDVCPNLEGAQESVPNGYVLTDGQCVVIPPVDFCPNLEGDQDTVPEGYTLDDGECVVIPPPPADACTNLEGDQASLPKGYYYASAGICLPNPVDFCPNLEGDQANVPEGYVLNDGQCVVINDETPDEEDEDTESTRYTLDITITGDGEGNVQAEESIACFSEGVESNCSSTYPAGTVVTLTATPNEGSNFDNSWTVGAGTCTGNNTPCTVTMNSNYSLIAHFDLDSSSGSGGGGTRVKRDKKNDSLTTVPDAPLFSAQSVESLPVGAPNTGAGGTANTVSLPLLLAVLEATREIRKK